MFKLEINPTFEETVFVTVAGEKEQRKLPLVFNHKTKSEIDLLVASAMGRSDLAIAQEIVKSVPGLPEGTTFESFFTELFEKFPASPKEVWRTWIRALTESRTKN